MIKTVMKKWRAISLFGSLMLLSSGLMGQGNVPEFWRNLKPGTHAVGYKVIHVFDYSRSFKPKYDYNGNLLKEENSRPVQISLWYPALLDEDPEYVKFEDYIFSKASEYDFSSKDESEKHGYLKTRKDIHVRRGADRKKLEDIYSRICNAVANAVPENGSFPLIIYAPGLNGSSFQNSYLNEYLASHGYVVAASPSTGKYSPEMTTDLIGIEAQTRDMEFVLAEMRDFPNVNKYIVGCIGYSFGGVSNIIFSLRNFNVDAALCLDGSISYGSAPRKIRSSPYYIPKIMRAAFMFMGSDSYQKEYEYDMHFYDNSIYADAYFLTFRDLLHRHFNSRQVLIYDHANADIGKDVIGHIDICYETICRYTLNFFDAYLKGDTPSKAFLDRTPEENNVHDSIISINSRKGYKAPPTEEQFFEIIKNKGVASAIVIFRGAREIDPEVKVFSKSGMNRVGYEFLNSKKIEEALEVFKLNVEVYPDYANGWDSLAEACLLNGDKQSAIQYYKKSLDLNPENQNAVNMLKELTE